MSQVRQGKEVESELKFVIPQVTAMLRQLENRGETPTLGEDGKPRRRQRRVKRSRHALFDTVHKGRGGRGMTPEDVYHQSLQWDDKQSLRSAGQLRRGSLSTADLSFTSANGTADAFSDQENDEISRVEREAMRYDITGDMPSLSGVESRSRDAAAASSTSRSASQQPPLPEAERSEAEIGKELFLGATVATQIEKGTHSLTREQQVARKQGRRGVPDGVAIRDPAVVTELYQADIAGLEMSYSAAASVIMQAALAGVEETMSREPDVQKHEKARVRAQVRETYVPPCSPLVDDARARLRCASLALSPLPLIFSYKSEKSLCGTGRAKQGSRVQRRRGLRRCSRISRALS